MPLKFTYITLDDPDDPDDSVHIDDISSKPEYLCLRGYYHVTVATFLIGFIFGLVLPCIQFVSAIPLHEHYWLVTAALIFNGGVTLIVYLSLVAALLAFKPSIFLLFFIVEGIRLLALLVFEVLLIVYLLGLAFGFGFVHTIAATVGLSALAVSYILLGNTISFALTLWCYDVVWRCWKFMRFQLANPPLPPVPPFPNMPPITRYFWKTYNWFPWFVFRRSNSANGTGKLNNPRNAFLFGIANVLEIPTDVDTDCESLPANLTSCNSSPASSNSSEFKPASSNTSEFNSPPALRHQQVQTDRIEEPIPPTSSDADPATHQQQDPTVTDGVGATSNVPSIPDVSWMDEWEG